MDSSYNCDLTKQCFKCDPAVINNLYIIYCSSNSVTILWNKFQIFVYENMNYETSVRIIVPEFQVRNLLISNNYIICLDCSRNIHVTSLKFKNALQKEFKLNFSPRDQNVIATTLFSNNQTISLKYESNLYFFYVHRIDTEYNIENKITLQCEKDIRPETKIENCILISHRLAEECYEVSKTIFNVSDIQTKTENNIVIFTVDKMNVFGCLLNNKMPHDQIKLTKLCSCPSEISNIEIMDSENLNIIIGLTIGTVLKLSLKDKSNPEILHLNTAISKMISFKNTMLYTDGISLWKAEKTKSDDIQFSQLFVKQVKDFIKIGDQIVCTTFMNLIYTFSLDDERSYLKPDTNSEYSPAEKLFNNYDYLNKILAEVKTHESIAKKLSKEKNYIMALSLSNREDIMNEVIDQKVFVYKTYEDALSENTDIVLTNNYAEYFDTKLLLFLLNIFTKPNNKIASILSSSLGDIKIHITIRTNESVLKTTSIKLLEQFKKINLLIPIEEAKIDPTEMNVDIKILCNIPGAFDLKKKMWALMYKKTVKLYSEHFLKLNINFNRNMCLKSSQKPLEKLLMETIEKQYGNLFEFTDISRNKPLLREWDMFVRLPENYQDVLKTEKYCENHLNIKKTKYFIEQFSSENFLKSKSNVILTIGDDKLKIEVHNDGFSNPLLKITGENLKHVLNIRNFLSNLIYDDKSGIVPGKTFVHHSFYITVENLQRAIRSCIAGTSDEDILPLIEQFERNVIGIIPV